MNDAPRSLVASVLTHYSESGNDYAAWSRGYNMHFGYYRLGLNPFDRERMLEEMTHQVTDRLGLDEGTPAQILDLGCGVGAPSRTLVRSNASARVVGVSLKFLINELVVRRTHLSRARWGHVLASLAAPIVGAARRYFGYHLVTATRGTA